MSHEEEQRLIRRVLGGDAEAFAPLVERYSRPIFSLIYGIVGRREECEELTQDLFLKAYSKLSTYRGASSFSTWLYRIAYNASLSAVRPRRHLFSLFDRARAERVADPSVEEQALAAHREAREEALLRALDRLSAEERALVQLHYYENKSLAECGEILGLTENNSKVRLHRIRKKLEQWISEKS